MYGFSLSAGSEAADVWLGVCVVGLFVLGLIVLDGVVWLIRNRKRG